MAYSAKEAQRAANIQKKRAKELEEAEIKRRKIEEGLQVGNITNKFSAHYDAIEQQLKSDTVGLVTLDEMRAKQKSMVREREQQLAQKNHDAHLKRDEEKKEKKQKEKIGALSFAFEDDDDDESESENNLSVKTEPTVKTEPGEVKPNPEKLNNEKKRLGMNPDVDTSFLPDREREEEEKQLRAKLAAEWLQRQEDIKSEDITITYSYWDGRGHRRSAIMKKGNTIYQFLQKCLETLRKEEVFNELKVASSDQLMYIKEDIILTHHSTFFEFIVTKARGKSGPLFNFDVVEDVRIKADAATEKQDSHAGKVVLRSWYERHKHIFPACRWEVFDPAKKWDHYSIKDREAEKNKFSVK